MASSKKASVVLVGCGCPLRSMGWYHAVQLLDDRCPSAELQYVVEPWFMSEAGSKSNGAEEFNAWKTKQEAERGIQFFATVSEVPAPAEGDRRLGVISARTSDNPKLLEQCIKIGCHSIYLEKPGAPTVAELEAMRDQAKEAGVTVLMGFNKNVAKYSTETMKAQTDKSVVTFVHNNNYAKEDLGECFERNSEGMLKNMAIHELALLVTFYGVSTETIEKVEADKEYSSCQTIKGPFSGNDFTDFDKLKFTVTTKAGVKVSVAADRCAGDDSVGIVEDTDGKEVVRFTMPDEDHVANKIPELEKQQPGAMPYFFVQDPDYLALKERIAKNCVDGSPAEGVASIDVAVETLKVAEYLTPLLQEQLLG